MSNVLARTQRSVGQEGWETGTVGWYMHTYAEKCSDWRPSVQQHALVLYRCSKDISLSSAPCQCALSSKCKEIINNGVGEQLVNPKAYFSLCLNLVALCKAEWKCFSCLQLPWVVNFQSAGLQSSCSQVLQPSHRKPSYVHSWKWISSKFYPDWNFSDGCHQSFLQCTFNGGVQSTSPKIPLC